ncbi:NUDIX domain-containing protein [Amycolatopsis sp. cmx-11-12]|uniref:NUDIX domain-containing protein n=1 Tax=Amycolatopsis sp. cmx-11-12 TaxID=2785795 RepID=UPI003917BF25
MSRRDRFRYAVAVDMIVLTVRERALQVLVVERAKAPFAGQLALPGGFLEDGEDLDQATHRELAEETGLDAEKLHIRQFCTYGAPDRDPRGPIMSVAYVALMSDLPIPTAGGDARAAHWTPVDELLTDSSMLAFDHHHILGDAVENARDLLCHTTLAATFCSPEFTISQLREVYETVWGVELEPSNFHRKVTRANGFLIPTGGKAVSDRGRRASLYRAGPATQLHPALLRESHQKSEH